MNAAQASYQKTMVATGLAAVLLIALPWGGQFLAGGFPYGLALELVFGIGTLLGLMLLLVALGCQLVMLRHARWIKGRPDLYIAANRSRSESALPGRTGAMRRVPFAPIRRWLCASDFVVGDPVRIRSLQEIVATLDSKGCLDGLPFMPEMVKFCGMGGTVFRCVDKVYDYGGKKDLRRIRDTVLLAGVRCDGSAHDGCQTGCLVLWKTAWLASADAPITSSTGPVEPNRLAPALRPDALNQRAKLDGTDAVERSYLCQFTEIVNASTEMSPWDPRQDLRPFIVGNVTALAFGVAMLTRLFNTVQRFRGGMGFPPAQMNLGAVAQTQELDLQPGERVRVAQAEKIFATLNRSGKNRGLWFDREMLKHCGQEYQVLRRVDKIIDDASCRMIRLKTPCIVLDGVDSSGEYLRFCAQHDYPFWREAWLERAELQNLGELSAIDRLTVPTQPLGLRNDAQRSLA